MNRVSAIIVAAGEGRRFGAAKQYAPLKGRTVLDWCLEKFDKHEEVDKIILVLGTDRSGQEYLDRYKKIVAIARGGKERQDSVYSGLSSVDNQETKIVLVHDGVRPLVGMGLISRVIKTTQKKGAVVPVLPVEDTLKWVEGHKVIRTEDRKRLFRSQTPQGFSCSLLREAFVRARRDNFDGTDEATLVERMGQDVFVVAGDPKNIKITTKEDLRIAEAFIED
jgi:2-C-methyl-D-erythritol 4-phosphate cytidylyltransferase